MKPLIVLLVSFGVSAVIIKFIKKEFDWMLAGRIAMSIMLCFTALGHFIFDDGMTKMIPQVIPFKLELVYLTGVMELMFAIALLIPAFQIMTAWSLLLFLLLLLPANIYAALNQVNYQTGGFDGPGLAYLWFRIPLQVFFIIWTYFSAMKR